MEKMKRKKVKVIQQYFQHYNIKFHLITFFTIFASRKLNVVMEDNGFRAVMEKKSNNELLEIIQTKRADYQESAIIDAENVLRERGISSDSLIIEEPEENIPDQIDDRNLILPIFVGILLVVLAIYSPIFKFESDIRLNIIINIVLRIITLVWANSIANRYRLNKALWITLGFLFAGWALIAINIAVWIKQASKK